MKQYDFTLVLSPGTELTDELVEALYESGCDDGSPGSRAGVVWVTLHREAESLEEKSSVGLRRATGLVLGRHAAAADRLRPSEERSPT